MDSLSDEDKKRLQQKLNQNNLLHVKSNSTNYEDSINLKQKEKKTVAIDYSSRNSLTFHWPPVFLIENEDSHNKHIISYIKAGLFYVIPLSITMLFSSIIYPKIVWMIKKITKVKGFWTINMISIPVLLFFNIRVYSLSQTYVGFKFIEYNYKQYSKREVYSNSHYNQSDYIQYLKYKRLI